MDDCNNKVNNCVITDIVEPKYDNIKDITNTITPLLVKSIENDIDELIKVRNNKKLVELYNNIIKIDVSDKIMTNMKILSSYIDNNIINTYINNIISPQAWMNFDTMVKILNTFDVNSVMYLYYIFLYRNDKNKVKCLLNYYTPFNQFKETDSKLSPIFLEATKYNLMFDKFRRETRTTGINYVNSDMLMFLFDNGVNPNLIVNGETHLIILIKNYSYMMNIINGIRKSEINFKLIKTLLDKMNKQYINYMNNEGRTALMYASELFNFKVTKLLLENNAKKSINTIDKKGNTALMLQIQEAGYLLINMPRREEFINNLQLLLENGASETINYKNIKGYTPLLEIAVLCQSNKNNDISILDQIIEILLKYDANPNIKDNTGKTSIDYYPKINDIIKSLNGACSIQ